MNISERGRVYTRRELTKKGLGPLYEQFSDVLFAHNPVGLPNRPGSRQDYGGVAGTLILRLARIGSVEELRAHLYDEMLSWYGRDAGPEDQYASIAQELWNIFQSFQETSAP